MTFGGRCNLISLSGGILTMSLVYPRTVIRVIVLIITMWSCSVITDGLVTHDDWRELCRIHVCALL